MTYQSILRQYWGYDKFRGIQHDIIKSIGSGHDTLGLMPTGGGKSITFQVPALAMHGICIVITPLIALMKDQVQALRRRGIKAAAVYSGMSHAEIVMTFDNCVLGDYKFLYISPERIGTELFQTKLRHMPISFVTIDEAHCISQWGHDFRPSYLQVAVIRQLVPDAPILALTASATPEVVEDICLQLRFRPGHRVCRMSFHRPNLVYTVRHTDNKYAEMLHILNRVPGSAIVYTRSRQQTVELAKYLMDNGITATNYHAGLSQDVKDTQQQQWQRGDYRVMVATNAFGMGIDKPDVRTVLHFETPDSPEAYFQEAGRAGRDGLRAYAVLLYEERDAQKLLNRIRESYPEPEYIRKVYEDTCYYLHMAMGDGQGVTREFDLQDFCYTFHHFPVPARNALVLLSRTGVIRYTENEEVNSRLMFALSRDELYQFREHTEQEECILHALLRKYSGIFSEYIYIDEHLLARETALDPHQVYFALKQLAHAGVLYYIPHRHTDYITFLSRRIEKEEIPLPPEIYSDRRAQYEQRIHAMLQYATDPAIDHAAFLLQYFGEK
ncbi:MAG: ATP-dependent DNA helicase RecQ [Bacteroidaceae bacterium]|nr:ATP-dependent DNA helicase RecQ [Bacteroidaceae bacterium]